MGENRRKKGQRRKDKGNVQVYEIGPLIYNL